MLEFLYAMALGAVAIAVRSWAYQTYFPPDHHTYKAMSEGRSAPNPFRLRWLYPALMPAGATRAWSVVSTVGVFLTLPAVFLFATASGVSGLWAVLLWASLPLVDVLCRMRGIVDHIAWPVALLTGAFFKLDMPGAGIIAALIAGMIDPRIPVFAAAWTLHPGALLGLIPVIGANAIKTHGAPLMHGDVILHPWRSARDRNGRYAHSAADLIAPWGACLAGIFSVSPAVAVSLAVSYGQMLCAIDRVRLYQWAAPAVIVAALQVIPTAWLPVAVLVTWFNPYRPEV